MSKNIRYPEQKIVVNNNTKQAVDNSEVDNSAGAAKPTINEGYTTVTNETIDKQITKNITSTTAIIKKYVFNCSPANYTDMAIVEIVLQNYMFFYVPQQMDGTFSSQSRKNNK